MKTYKAKAALALTLCGSLTACIEHAPAGDMTPELDMTPDVSIDAMPDLTPDITPDPVDTPPDIPECIPQTCPADFCGQMPDGCDGMLVCGQDAKTCEDYGATACGPKPDGCGASLDCGTCVCDVTGADPSVVLEPTCGPCGLGATTCTQEGVAGCVLPEFEDSDVFYETLRCEDIMYVDATLPGLSGSGSKSEPFSSLVNAVTFEPPLIVVKGSQRLTGPLLVREGVSIFGGYLDDFVYRPNVLGTFASDIGPSQEAHGVVAQDINAKTVLHGLAFAAPDAQPGKASIGMIVRDAPGLVLSRVRVRAGRGGDGQPGVLGAAGANGDPGLKGDPGFAFANRYEGSTCPPNTDCAAQMRGVGGSNASCPGRSQGGDGGKGGFAFQIFGQAGESGAGGASGGSSGPVNGKPGTTGAVGAIGDAGRSGISSLGDLTAMGIWSPGSEAMGAGGGPGAPGEGGGGGGGGPIAMSEHSGAAGSGGGAGGCGGAGASGGSPGYASIGLVLSQSTGIELRDVEVMSGEGGAGGTGAEGGPGGRGGAGGASQTQGWSSSAKTSQRTLVNTGGPGGFGGQGGQGGASGGGAGGPSVGLWCLDSTPRLFGQTSFTSSQAGLGGKGVDVTQNGRSGESRDFNGCIR